MRNNIAYHRGLLEQTLLCIIFVLLFPVTGASQTRFEFPDNRVDVTRYTHLMTCTAMIDRVRDSLYAHSDILLDTLADPQSFLEYQQDALRPVAKECVSRFKVSDLPLYESEIALNLFLLAGRDEQALAVANRWLGSVSPTDTIERAFIIAKIVRGYRTISPVDWRTLRSFFDQLDPIGQPSQVWWIWSGLHNGAVALGTESERDYWLSQYHTQILTMFKKLPDPSIPENDEQVIRGLATHFGIVSQQRNLMDSLSKSTACYLKTLNNIRALYFGDGQGSNNDRTRRGEAIPKLEGDFVFPKSDKPEMFPRPGKVTLFITIWGDARKSLRHLTRFSQIRRLKHMFPDLDIVLVTATTGAVVPLPPPSPAEEAEFFSTLLEFYRVPATLVVMNRPYFHLSDPDRRRVNLPLEGEWDPKNTDVALLVDRNGTLVEQMSLLGDRKTEKKLTDLIQAVFQQN